MSIWKTGKKESIDIETIFSILKQVARSPGHKIIIGSDSVKLGYEFIFTNAICIINKDFYDRRYFYCRKKINDDSYLDLSKRLLKETSDSIEIALQIRNKIESANIEIHSDVNSNIAHKSAKYKNMVSGYISGCGFSVKIKPDSFVASGIADCHTRKI